MNEERLKKIIEEHKKWLVNEEQGERANLKYADLRYADLRDADLRDVNLRGAFLKGADLSQAKGLVSQIDYMQDTFEQTDEGFIVYKTFNNYYEPPSDWRIEKGAIITENVNFGRTSLCGCGINVATREWIEIDASEEEEVWKCLIKYEWLSGVCVPYSTSGKIRAEKVKILRKIKEGNNGKTNASSK